MPLPTVHQAAVMDLAGASDEMAARWRTDPQEAAAWLRELVADSAVLTGLLALQEARTAPDPSTAAELCLSAVPHIALAVTLAGADLD